MIEEPQCVVRQCVHFRTVKNDGGNETTERVVCDAFPNGIPDIIAYGKNLHLESVKGDHGIQFEKAK